MRENSLRRLAVLSRRSSEGRLKGKVPAVDSQDCLQGYMLSRILILACPGGHRSHTEELCRHVRSWQRRKWKKVEQVRQGLLPVSMVYSSTPMDQMSLDLPS